MRFLVLGSINIDESFRVSHIVRPGETLQSAGFSRNAGGKGANQAAALALAGANVFLAGKIGSDGIWVLDQVRGRGADVGLVGVDGCSSTGRAEIMVSDDGENAILLCPGCNHLVDESYVNSVISKFGEGDWIVLQNETSCVPHAIAKAHEVGMRVVLNPSPFDDAVRNAAIGADMLILNETEARGVTCASADDGFDSLVSRLAALHSDKDIVLTLGARGSVFIGSGKVIRQDAFEVETIDTTAAGDTFLGYFIASFACGNDPKSALAIASKASAIAVTRRGAMCSIPTRDEVMRWLF